MHRGWKKGNSILYGERDCFAVPLGNSHVMGLIARGNSRTRVLFGYFFGPSLAGLGTDLNLPDKSPSDAILVGQFGDLYLSKGRWQIVGRVEPWSRAAWPFGPLGRIDSLVPGRAYRVWYDNDNPALVTRKETCEPEDILGLPNDGVMGAEFVERRLQRLLS